MKIKIELESFHGFIGYDGYSWTPTKYGIAKSGQQPGKTTETQLGHCMTLPSAINRIVREVLGNSKDVLTLNEFLVKYQSLTNQIESLANVEG